MNRSTNAIGSVLVDTSVVVDYFRQDRSLHAKIDQVEDLYLPLVVLGELFYGAHKAKQKDKVLAQVHAFSNACIIILPNETTAELYGRIKGELSTEGRTIPENDVWISAVARQHNLPLATRDRHFSFVAGLTLLDW